jgi:hypothetical protein
MGKTLTGGVQHKGNVSMLTPEQQRFLSGVLGPNIENAQQVFGQFLNPAASSQEAFKTSVVDPTMLSYNQDFLPQLRQQFADQGASSSSALNNALARSARDLGTVLGGNYQQFQQGQQQNQLNALQMLSGLGQQQTFTPLIRQNQGLLGPLIGSAAQAGAAYLGKPF